MLGAKLLPQGAPTAHDKQQHTGALDREKRELDARLAQLAEGSLALLELIFPRHIIEFMSDSHQATQRLLPPGTDLTVLASRHELVRVWGGGGGGGPCPTMAVLPPLSHHGCTAPLVPPWLCCTLVPPRLCGCTALPAL